jgi:AhpD family alkylhydroperoxidase
VETPFAKAADDVVAGLALIRESAPAAMKAFGSLAAAATAPKALDTRTKELMALAISVAVRCGGCVAYHTRASLKAGASREEIAETVALAVYMGGGPAAVYGADALRAFDEYAAQAPE